MVAWSKFSKTRLRGGADLLFFKMAENEGASEMKSGFRSVVIGGTGATGRCLVRELLKSKVSFIFIIPNDR